MRTCKSYYHATFKQRVIYLPGIPSIKPVDSCFGGYSNHTVPMQLAPNTAPGSFYKKS